MKTEMSPVIVAGFRFENIEGKKELASVFLLEKEKSCREYLIADGVDKDKTFKELIQNYRKEIKPIIDLKEDYRRPDSNYVIVKFVGIKNC